MGHDLAFARCIPAHLGDYDAGKTSNLHLGEAGDCFRPAKCFFDQLAFSLARPVARVPRRAAVDGRVSDLGCDVRRHSQAPAVRDEAFRVVSPVGPKCQLPMRPGPGGSSDPSLARKLFNEPHASTSVPSTEK
jgi:hypothetical protein